MEVELNHGGGGDGDAIHQGGDVITTQEDTGRDATYGQGDARYGNIAEVSQEKHQEGTQSSYTGMEIATPVDVITPVGVSTPVDVITPMAVESEGTHGTAMEENVSISDGQTDDGHVEKIKTKVELTTQQLHEVISSMVTEETLPTLTRRLVRTNLENYFALPEDALLSRKQEINDLLGQVMSQIADQEAAAPTTKQSTTTKESGMTTRKRKSEVVHEDEDDEDAEMEDDESSSDMETSRSRRAKKKPAAKGRALSMKKVQGSLMTKEFFTEKAQPLESKIGPLSFTMAPREFSTGSCGWFYGSKHEFEIDGKPVVCQMTVNCTVLGSRTWAAKKRKK